MDHADVIGAIRGAREHVGADVLAHAIDIDGGAEIGVHPDDPVVTASVFKVPVLTEYVRQVASGELDPTRRIRISPADGTPGDTGLSVFCDDADWSLRDIATSMITVSDNAATDIVTALVGRARVNATMAELGLPRTVMVGDCAALFATMLADYDTSDFEEVDRLMHADPVRVPALAVSIPEQTNRSTPRECTTLLRLLWTDAAADPDACAEARRILGMQVWSHRLGSGFPSDDVKVSGKTGTLGVVRNEIGVVELPDGHRFAVAVFLRTHRFGYRQPDADALIGTVARILTNQLHDV